MILLIFYLTRNNKNRYQCVPGTLDLQENNKQILSKHDEHLSSKNIDASQQVLSVSARKHQFLIFENLYWGTQYYLILRNNRTMLYQFVDVKIPATTNKREIAKSTVKKTGEINNTFVNRWKVMDFISEKEQISKESYSPIGESMKSKLFYKGYKLSIVK